MRQCVGLVLPGLAGWIACAPFLCAIAARPVVAQGLAGASIEGVVRNSAGAPLADVLLTLADSARGTSRTFLTRERGTYRFDHVAVGETYYLQARRVGFASASSEPLALHIGDRLVRDFVLDETRATPLARVDVRLESHRNAGAGGLVYSIPGDAVRNLPLRNRDVVGLFGLVPQAASAASLSLSGQHTRFNAIQVDGSAGGDFFGVSVTPGATSGARLLSIEALEEMRVLVAPFDVSLGGFSGGLVNLVTRSGTNEHAATLFTSFADTKLVGDDTAGNAIDEFRIAQFGLRAGGPLIRDRLHYFAVADLQASTTPFTGPTPADPSTGISAATALRASTAFRDVYGFDAGTAAEPTLHAPSRNLFGKLSWQAPTHTVELTHAIADGSGDELGRGVRNRVNRDGWQLSRSGATRRGQVATTRVRATSNWGQIANEFVASLSTIDEERRSRNNTPLFLVQGDVPGNYLAGGSVFNAQATVTSQRILDLTNNLSWSLASHVLTAGTQNQLVHIRDNLFPGAWGAWTFANVDSLERRSPDRFERALALRPGGPLANFDAANLAGYVQDRWRVTDRLDVSVGVRADAALVFDKPSSNSALAANVALGGIRTDRVPSGNALYSPRIGFAYTLRDGRTLVRGGAGAFASRAPYVWLTGTYENTGLEQATLVCTRADGVPAPTTSLASLPDACTGGATAPSPVPSISYFTETFRYQHAVKYALGVDHRFGRGGVSASLDATYITSHDALYVSDMNLVARGESGERRSMYGTISANGTARPTRLDSTAFARVFRFESKGGGRSRAVSASIEKQWGGGGLLQAAYSWSRAEDVMSLAGFTGTIIFQNNPLDGTIAERRLSRSTRDIPHSLSAAAVIPLPYGVTASLFLRARSGTPYAFIADGDANADGTAGNDLAYIPADSNDISLTNPAAYGALDAFIRGEPCLREQRGRVMRRNTCRNPFVASLDTRVTKSIDVGGRSVTFVVDVFNAPNLVNKRWGLVRETTTMESTPLLRVAGWDDANARPRYSVAVVDGQFVLPSIDRVVIDPSRWRIQFGARVDF